MSLSIVDRDGVLSDGLRQFAERRLNFALARFDSKVQRISAIVEDVNGPRGGADKSCRIIVTLRRAGEIVISDQDADAAKCIARAAERAGRAVGRAIERSRYIDRSRPLDPGSMPTS